MKGKCCTSNAKVIDLIQGPYYEMYMSCKIHILKNISNLSTTSEPDHTVNISQKWLNSLVQYVCQIPDLNPIVQWHDYEANLAGRMSQNPT